MPALFLLFVLTVNMLFIFGVAFIIELAYLNGYILTSVVGMVIFLIAVALELILGGALVMGIKNGDL